MVLRAKRNRLKEEDDGGRRGGIENEFVDLSSSYRRLANRRTLNDLFEALFRLKESLSRLDEALPFFSFRLQARTSRRRKSKASRSFETGASERANHTSIS